MYPPSVRVSTIRCLGVYHNGKIKIYQRLRRVLVPFLALCTTLKNNNQALESAQELILGRIIHDKEANISIRQDKVQCLMWPMVDILLYIVVAFRVNIPRAFPPATGSLSLALTAKTTDIFTIKMKKNSPLGHIPNKTSKIKQQNTHAHGSNYSLYINVKHCHWGVRAQNKFLIHGFARLPGSQTRRKVKHYYRCA